jgi:DNA-binding GntR family transcriptional regulator
MKSKQNLTRHQSISERTSTRRVPLREKIYDKLEEQIIYGDLEPGRHLVEAEISSQLGASRIPVREALQLLHSRGWVDLHPDKGAFVHVPIIQEVKDTFGVRIVLEGESARLAAENATEESIQDLEELVEKGRRLLSRSPREIVRLNSEFHSALAQMSGNHVLESLLARLDKRIRWYFAPVAKLRGPESWKEHIDIVKALDARDSDEAERVMRRHAQRTEEAEFEAIEGHRFEPSFLASPEE